MKNRRSFSLLFFVALQGIATAFAPPAGKNSPPAPRQRSKNNYNIGGPSWGILVNNHRLAASGGRSNNNDNEWGIPHHSELAPLSQSARPVTVLPNGGRLTLLGAGPGDPDLLTVAAYRLLTTTTTTTAQRKDGTGGTVIIADRLVAPEILNLIDQRNCDVKVARKLPGCAELAQEEIYWWIYQGLRDGKHVIRLKIGDPFVFGRGGEEVLTCRTFGVEAKVIPGVSSAFSAPLLGNIPVTHRGVANQVVLCTGYGRDGTSPDLIQYHKEQTIVFLMAVGRLQELCDRLHRLAGYPQTTPVAIVERAGCPNQRTVVGDMTTIADLATRYQVQPPSTIIVGEVVRVLLRDNDDKSLYEASSTSSSSTSTRNGSNVSNYGIPVANGVTMSNSTVVMA